MDTPQSQPPVVQDQQPVSVMNTPADQAPQQPIVPPAAQPPVQEAAAALTVPTKKSHTMMWVVFLFILMAITGVLAYVAFVMNRPSAPETQNQTPSSVNQVQNVPTATPAPRTESEEVDQIDTTYPTSDVTSIENDVKSL